MSTTTELNPAALEDSFEGKLITLARNFTKAFQSNMDAPVPVREARCMATQYPYILTGIHDNHLFAGTQWTYEFLVGFNLELYANTNIEVVVRDCKPDRELTEKEKDLRSKLTACSGGFYYDYGRLHGIADNLPEDSELASELRDIAKFWETNSTMYHYNQQLTDEINEGLGRVTSSDLRYANSFGSRICCYSIDNDKLLQLGLPGLRDLIKKKMQETAGDAEKEAVYTGMLLTLDVLESVLDYYLADATAKINACTDPVRKGQLVRIADSVKHLKTKKPESLHQAIQLWWIYTVLADIPNYGRMDQWLGDFYVSDIDSGRITEEDAFAMLECIYQMVTERRYHDAGSHAMPNSRIILGGMGRRNPENADRFARLALRVTRHMNVTEPQTTLRFYEGQDPELFEMALDAIASGAVYPILYNDDQHVPWVAKAYNVSLEEAEQYVPEGCGEIQIDHTSVGSPNNIINYISGLDLVLHNGFDTGICEQRGLQLGTLDSFDTFEKLVDAWKVQTHATHVLLAKRHAAELRALKGTVAFNFLSILSDDCIDRGKTLFGGGVRYAGGLIESFGLTNVADSLWAIKEMVFERKEMTLQEIVQMCDADWKGFEREKKMFLNLPKFGNDHEGVDELHREVSDYACQSAYDAAEGTGLHFFLICNLNPGAGYYRYNTKASADGRVFGEAMAYGNNPTAGRDHSGLTSVLNSICKNDHLHSGYVHNIKMSKGLLSGENRERTKALIDTYFKSGGCQLMVTVIDQKELEDAQKHPEKYPDLIVRVAGWNARFVHLNPVEQNEIMNRTFYS
jgi:pyruvate-formate lyase